jgi:hypothetical protein
MKKLIMALIALSGICSLHQVQAQVVYQNNFEGVQAGDPGVFGNYNLDGTNWSWGVTGYGADGGFLFNYFPGGGPNKGLYGLRIEQGGVAQGVNVMQFGGAYDTPANVANGKSQTTTFVYNVGAVTQGMVNQGYASLGLNYKVMNQQFEFGFNTPSTGRFFIEVLGQKDVFGPDGTYWYSYLTTEAGYGASTSFSLLSSQTDWNNDVILNLALDSSLVGKTINFGIDLNAKSDGNGGFSRTGIAVDNIVFQTASAPVAIPEPSVASLLGFGVLGLVATRFRRRS